MSTKHLIERCKKKMQGLASTSWEVDEKLFISILKFACLFVNSSSGFTLRFDENKLASSVVFTGGKIAEVYLYEVIREGERVLNSDHECIEGSLCSGIKCGSSSMAVIWQIEFSENGFPFHEAKNRVAAVLVFHLSLFRFYGYQMKVLGNSL